VVVSGGNIVQGDDYMSNFITINKLSRDLILKSGSKIKEGLKMSLINLSLNISYFNIDINIKKNEEKKRKLMYKRIEHELRIKEIMEERRNIEIKHKLYNMIW